MKIVTTFHPPSSVLCSLKCRLAARDIEHLVIAKLNRIEVYSLRPEGLHLECTAEIWGKVLSVKAVPIPRTVRSSLVLLIAHPDPELVFFSYKESAEDSSAELTANKLLSLYERTPRPTEFCQDIIVHPSGKLAAVCCYTGKLKIITFKSGNYATDFDVSLPELNVLSLAFLPVSDTDTVSVAVLHIDYQERIQLLAHDINVHENELSPEPSTRLHPTAIANKIFPMPDLFVPQLVPVPPEDEDEGMAEDKPGFLGGLLVLGGKKIVFYELSEEQAQEKQRGKRRRLEERKASRNADEVSKAKEKEKERAGRQRKPSARVEWPWSQVTAWCALDELPLRYLIGDSYGKLSILSLEYIKDRGLVLIPLGESSSPTTLTYLTSQIIYVGSHMGDSQLLQISNLVADEGPPTLPIPAGNTVTLEDFTFPGSARKGKAKETGEFDMDVDEDVTDNPSSINGCIVATKGSRLTVLETFKNIAPIIDGVLVDTDGSGQRQIVTCSGGRNTGSLNVVRNGADFEELAFATGITDSTGIWAIRDMFNDTTDTHILISTLESSQLFKINSSGGNTSFTAIADQSPDGIITKESTIAFSNFMRRISKDGKSSYIDSSLVVQVTPSGVFLLEYDVGMGVYVNRSSWKPEISVAGIQQDVVAASINASQIALAIRGGKIVLLNIINRNELNQSVAFDGHREISAISCTPLDDSKPHTRNLAVAYWDTNEIEVFKIGATLQSISKTKESLSTLVRSILFFDFGANKSFPETETRSHLIAGLADGSVVSFLWKENKLGDRKIISLGSAPVALTTCEVDGEPVVLASGNRATVLSWEKKRLIHSPIMLKEIVAACTINAAPFGSALIVASSTGLFVGRIKELDKLHIRSIPLGLDNPRRIAYEPSLKVFGVACTRTEPVRIADADSPISCFKLLDDTTFATLSQFNFDSIDEEITSVASFSATHDGKNLPMFCVGTYVYKGETEPTTGRLLVFRAALVQAKESTLELSLVTSTDVNGCVYALNVVDGKIIAAVNSSVMMFYLDISSQLPSSTSYKLKPLLPVWNHNYLVTSLGSYGSNIVVGDQISSVSLLKIEDNEIKSIAKDYGPLWPVCVDAIDANHIIGANDALNIFSFSLVQNLGRSVLERDGTFHVADMVTKFVRGSLSSDSATTSLIPEQMFFTSSGRIGTIIDVKDDTLSLNLTSLERNLASLIAGIGGGSHSKFRAPKNTRGSSDADLAAFGFVDGDFLEQFLALLGIPEQIERVMSGRSEPERLKQSVEEIQKLLENLQSLH